MGFGVIPGIKWAVGWNAATAAKPRTWQMVRVRGSITAAPVPFLMEVPESEAGEPVRERGNGRETAEGRVR